MKPVKLSAVFIHLDSDLIPIKKRSKLKSSASAKAPKAASKNEPKLSVKKISNSQED